MITAVTTATPRATEHLNLQHDAAAQGGLSSLFDVRWLVPIDCYNNVSIFGARTFGLGASYASA
jgi:hypothetical protein